MEDQRESVNKTGFKIERKVRLSRRQIGVLSYFQNNYGKTWSEVPKEFGPGRHGFPDGLGFGGGCLCGCGCVAWLCVFRLLLGRIQRTHSVMVRPSSSD